LCLLEEEERKENHRFTLFPKKKKFFSAAQVYNQTNKIPQKEEKELSQFFIFKPKKVTGVK